MGRIWLSLSLVAASIALASAANAQRFPQIMNMNTHEGKFSTGGFGVAFGVGGGGGSVFRRETPGVKNVDGALEAVFKKRNSQAVSRTIFGAAIDFQIGSDNDVIGTDFGIDLVSMAISTGSTLDVDNDAFEGINENVTLMSAGFDFTINFYKSEFIETDGRRTRDAWGLAMILGPKATMMFGDFSDLNGLASFGLDIGLMADIPIAIPGAEDLLSISPYIWLEVNYRLGVDGALVDTNPASPTFGQDVLNDNFDVGFYSRSQEDLDGNGLPDFDGMAVRRHNFIPAYQINLGFDVNLTPIFISRSGGIINNWRFHFSTIISMPIHVPFLMSSYAGDSLYSAGEDYPVHFMVVFGAAYFF